MTDDRLVRLRAFSVDEPNAALPFSRRLAHENGWTETFARRVIDEYKRFVWLAVRAGHPVTPSPAVDEAWHLHLCYTRSYWDELCGRVLGRPLHHEPTRGGAAEDAKFARQYERTLGSYRECFGEEPPADIWPRARERSSRRRSAVLLAATCVLGGCSSWFASVDVGVIAIGVGVVIALLVALCLIWRHPGGKDGSCDSSTAPNGCDSGCASDGCGGGGD